MRETERRQKRDRVSTNGAKQPLDADSKDPLVVTYVARIAAMAHELISGSTVRAGLGFGECQVGKLTAVGLDIGAEVCDNNHVGGRARGEILGENSARLGPCSFLAK